MEKILRKQEEKRKNINKLRGIFKNSKDLHNYIQQVDLRRSISDLTLYRTSSTSSPVQVVAAAAPPTAFAEATISSASKEEERGEASISWIKSEAEIVEEEEEELLRKYEMDIIKEEEEYEKKMKRLEEAIIYKKQSLIKTEGEEEHSSDSVFFYPLRDIAKEEEGENKEKPESQSSIIITKVVEPKKKTSTPFKFSSKLSSSPSITCSPLPRLTSESYYTISSSESASSSEKEIPSAQPATPITTRSKKAIISEKEITSAQPATPITTKSKKSTITAESLSELRTESFIEKKQSNVTRWMESTFYSKQDDELNSFLIRFCFLIGEPFVDKETRLKYFKRLYLSRVEETKQKIEINRKQGSKTPQYSQAYRINQIQTKLGLNLFQLVSRLTRDSSNINKADFKKVGYVLSAMIGDCLVCRRAKMEEKEDIKEEAKTRERKLKEQDEIEKEIVRKARWTGYQKFDTHFHTEHECSFIIDTNKRQVIDNELRQQQIQQNKLQTYGFASVSKPTKGMASAVVQESEEEEEDAEEKKEEEGTISPLPILKLNIKRELSIEEKEKSEHEKREEAIRKFWEEEKEETEEEEQREKWEKEEEEKRKILEKEEDELIKLHLKEEQEKREKSWQYHNE